METHERLVICLILAFLLIFLSPPMAATAQGTFLQPGLGQQKSTAPPEPVTGQTFYGLPGMEQRLAALNFLDTRGHWAFLPVLRLAAQGLIRGRNPGIFAPEALVTREEAVAFLKRAAGLEGGSSALPNFTPEEGSRPAQRQEVAAWVARALELTPASQGIYPLLAGFSDGGQVAEEWAPWVEALLQRGVLSGTTSGTLAPRAPITRAEMAALLDRADKFFMARRGVLKVEGKVVDKAVSIGTDGGVTYTLRVATFAGPVINLEARAAAYGAPLIDFPFYNGELLTLGRELVPGQAVRLLLQGEYVLLAENLGEGGYWTGRIIASDGQELLLVDDKGEQRRYRLTPLVKREIVPGQEVTLLVQGGFITQLVPVEASSTPAYSYQEPQIIVGQVREIKGSTLAIATPYGEAQARITASTSISRAGRALELADLKVGDKIKARVDAGGQAVDIHVGTGFERIIAVLYGRLERADYLSGRIVLRDTQEFYYGRWLPGSPIRSINLAREALPQSRLNLSSEKVLVALAKGPQGEEGVQVVRTGENTRLYEGYLDFISLGGNKLWLAGEKEPFLLGSHSMVVKNGQRAAPEDLQEGDYLFLVTTPGTDGRQVALALTESFLPPSWALYRGEIYAVGKDSLEIDDAEKLGGAKDQYDWAEAEDDSMEFQLSWEPVILSNGKILSREEFTQSRFTEEFYGYRAYLLARRKEVRGLSLYPPGTVDLTKMSLGRVKYIDYSSARLTVEAVRDWSPGYQIWQSNDFPLDLALQDALVIKGRQIVSWEDIAGGDSLYLVHDHRRALLVVVPD